MWPPRTTPAIPQPMTWRKSNENFQHNISIPNSVFFGMCRGPSGEIQYRKVTHVWIFSSLFGTVLWGQPPTEISMQINTTISLKVHRHIHIHNSHSHAKPGRQMWMMFVVLRPVQHQSVARFLACSQCPSTKEERKATNGRAGVSTTTPGSKFSKL